VYRELRVYTVRPGEMDAWIAEWLEHVYPLRRSVGFHIPHAWVVEEEDRFIWVLEYSGADYDAANQAYYASPERQAVDPEPSRHLAKAEHWVLRSVL